MTSSQADPAGLDPEAVRRAADEILGRPEYREPQPTLVDRALEAIGDLLGRAVGALTGGGAGSVIGTVVVVAVLALAGWLLVRALATPRPRLRRAATTGTVQGTEAPDDPAVWAAEAQRLADAGDHRGALRCRYQELVARLVRARVVAHRPARTPAELHAELAAERPDLAADLAEVTRRFEAVWYGGLDVDGAGEQRFRELAGSVGDRASQRPAVPT